MKVKATAIWTFLCVLIAEQLISEVESAHKRHRRRPSSHRRQPRHHLQHNQHHHHHHQQHQRSSRRPKSTFKPRPVYGPPNYIPPEPIHQPVETLPPATQPTSTTFLEQQQKEFEGYQYEPPASSYGTPMRPMFEDYSSFYPSQTTPGFVNSVYPSYEVPQGLHEHPLAQDPTLTSYESPGALNSYGVPVTQHDPSPSLYNSPDFTRIAYNEEKSDQSIGANSPIIRHSNHNYDGPGVDDDLLRSYLRQHQKELHPQI